MRTYFASVERAKQIARVLAEYFPALKLMQAQEWVAQICGYRNWHELREETARQAQPASLLMPEFDWEGYAYKRVPESAYEDYLRASELAEPLFAAQIAVLKKLLEPYDAQKAASDAWSFALNAAPGDIRYPKAVQAAPGAPLYEELKRPWFVRESHIGNTEPQEVISDSEWTTLGDPEKVWSLDGYEIWCGFKNRRQLDRYLENSTGQPAAILSMMRQSLLGEQFSQQFPLDGGGSDIRTGVDSSGRQVIEQSTRYRYWAADRRHRIAARLEVSLRVSAWATADEPDTITIVLGDSWCASGELAQAVFHGHLVHTAAYSAAQSLEHFARCRISQQGHAVVNFICFDNPRSLEVFKSFRGDVLSQTEVEGFLLKPERFKVSASVASKIPTALASSPV